MTRQTHTARQLLVTAFAAALVGCEQAPADAGMSVKKDAECVVVDKTPQVVYNNVTKHYTSATYDFAKARVTYEAMVPNRVLFGPNSVDDKSDPAEAAFLEEKVPRSYSYRFSQMRKSETKDALRAYAQLGYFTQCKKPAF